MRKHLQNDSNVYYECDKPSFGRATWPGLGRDHWKLTIDNEAISWNFATYLLFRCQDRAGHFRQESYILWLVISVKYANTSDFTFGAKRVKIAYSMGDQE